MRAIQITEFGGPEVLRLVEMPEPEPAPGQILIRVDRAGVNYADTHQAENSYLSEATLPLVPGGEVAGRTLDGRRVVALVGIGGYAEAAVAPESLAFDIPDALGDTDALALLVQGTTAWHLLRTSSRMEPGESVVVHAAAGGVGTLAVQLAKRWGAGRVIATASSEEKRRLATELGAHAAIDASPDGLRDRIIEANGGRKVDIVLEMTGGGVFDASLAALAPFGRLVTYGMASREPPRPVDARALMARSRAVVGFWLIHCLARRKEMIADPIAELASMIETGELRTIAGGEYPLSLARRAHEDLRARRTVGKLVLDPTS